MDQIVTIAKVAGQAAKDFHERVGELSKLASERDVRVMGDGLVAWIQQNKLVPPILYYCQYADHWSGANNFERYFNASVGLKVSSGTTELYSYRLPDDGTLVATLTRAIDERGFQFDEDAWFANGLRNAATFAERIASEATIVIVREVIGATLTDDDIRSALTAPLRMD
jgi:hypothetical protein